MAKNRGILPGVLATVLLVALPGIQCNKASCESLRDELHAEKLRWQTCEVDTDCIKIGGSSRDCTGVLSCDLAVNRANRLEAERRIASLPEETVECFECGSPNCVAGDIALCESVTKRCIIVTELIEVEPMPEPNGETPSNAGASALGAASVDGLAGEP